MQVLSHVNTMLWGEAEIHIIVAGMAPFKSIFRMANVPDGYHLTIVDTEGVSVLQRYLRYRPGSASINEMPSLTWFSEKMWLTGLSHLEVSLL